VLIPVNDLSRIWRIQPSSVLHVGAHLAEEEPDYRINNWNKISWVEAQPRLVELLRKKLSEGNTVYEAAVWDESGIRLTFNIASNSQSSSLLKFGSHLDSYPEITFTEEIEVSTVTLEEILPSDYYPDFVNLDLQGVELKALKGLGSKINAVKWIYCEVNKEEVYEDCTLLPELDKFLEHLGFKRLYIQLAPPRTWGDALYARKGLYSRWEIYIMRISQYLKLIFLQGYFIKIKRAIKRFRTAGW
jgi:FkbM family methyltransferase